MKTKRLLLAFLFFALRLIAQNSNEQLELKVENDKLVLDDKYYTSGFFLTYRKDIDQDFIFKKKETQKIQLNITLGNETYTPTDLQSIDTRDFDRPYAGWLFTKFEVGNIKENSALFLALEAGITGEEALSGSIQTWAHDFLNIDIPTWIQEIEFKFLVNLKAQYILNKRLGKSHALQYRVEPALGTKDIFLSNNVAYTFGRINNFNASSRNNIIDRQNSNEFYGFFNLGHRYVLHNTLLQGSLDFNDQTFTTSSQPHVFQFAFGGVLKWNRNIVGLAYNFNTKETSESSSHAYGSLRYSRNF